jgi:hypothetical protein
LKYCDFDENGELLGARHYDNIKLFTGAYTVERPFMIIDVEKAEIVIVGDENSEEIMCEEEGQEIIAADIDYYLGNILEKSGC